ncbi:MAG: type II toxin-antitoxin system RelE/ParE family toxin [Betaproteobacteria bacterium]|nr:type II toxin-antitoxin system RelE/ParE family toxin [Betaproteobacteria bacterium]
MVHCRSGAVSRIPAYFFATRTGREPVREWLLGLDAGDRKHVGAEIAYVQAKWPLGKPRVDHVRGRVWEVRVALAVRVARVLFAMDDGEMVLLHGFIKKTRRTDADDIALALERWKEWRHAKGE